METEVPRLDEFEREEVVEEEVPAEEQVEEEPVEEEAPAEEQPEEGQETPEEELEKPEKPIKGPRFLGWTVAVLVMLFGLMMLVPSVWYAVLALPAAGGLISEAGRNYESAAEAYEFLYNTDMSAQSFGLSGISSGNFSMERQYAVWGKLNGPMFIVQHMMEGNIPPIADAFPSGVPRSLRELAAQCDELTEIIESYYAQLNSLGQPAEGQSESEWLLETLEGVRAQDKKADARKLYYEAIALMHTAGDPAQKEANLARIALLKKDPAAGPWMYEDTEFYYAREDGDYAALKASCDARLKRNREDLLAMQNKVKALYLGEGAKPALAAADAYAKKPAAKNSMQLAKAEIYYRDGDYEKAVALCDAVLAEVDFAVPAATSAEVTAQRAAMEAAGVKGVVLLLQGNPEEALKLLNDTWDAASINSVSPSLTFVYTVLTAYAAGGEWQGEEAQGLVMQLAYSGYKIPQAVTDLSEGKTTVEKIFTEGWGGFDA